MTDVFDQVRQACADVADRARHVRIDQDAVAQLAALLPRTPPELLPEEQGRGEPGAIAAKVVAWNMVNFGSGWFPKLAKRDGLSGARSLAQAFDEHIARHGAPTAPWLVAIDVPACAELFGQPHPGPVDELLRLFTQAWNDLGWLLLERYDGQAANLVEAAKGSAAKLVGILDQMPLVHDVARYNGHAVPFFKRAQITASHLHRALGEPGPGELGHFTDLGRLTAFADNLVPHTLRMLDVLVYDDETAARIAGDDLFTPGEPAEIEIRACGVHAIELVVEHLAHPPAPDGGSDRDRPEPVLTDAATLDHHLWQIGQTPEIKAVRRHRCRCPWY